MDTAIAFFQGRDEFDEPSEVAAYRVFVHGVEVEVMVRDFGEAAGDTRYSAVARYADAPFGHELVMNTYGLSLGKRSATVEGALASVHWDVFPPLG
ncbi:hypothetical protein [Demequina sp.]|uniref:hypothetical protein n=1 Tax=Demequina sp. TaxID=2050685 RepID=UPI0025E6A5C0|nr:hypothetical protein [Demequina sp.]